MKYKFSPIFKYILLLLSIFMFIKHLKVLNNSENFLISISILFMVIIFDYVFIEDHPNLVMEDESENDSDVDSEIEQFYNSVNEQEEYDDDDDDDDDVPMHQVQKYKQIQQQKAPQRRRRQIIQNKAIKPAFDIEHECEDCVR